MKTAFTLKMLANTCSAAAVTFAATFVTIFTTTSHAGSFQILENDASGTGSAHANRAEAGSVSSMTANPASMAYRSGTEFSVSATAINLSAQFTNNGSTSAVGSPMVGGNGGNAGGGSVIPGLYFATSLSNSVRVGVGVTSPYSLRTEWEPGWVGRYFALRTNLETIDINPSISFKVSDSFAIGVGISAQRATAELSKAIDFGSLCFATLSGQLGPINGPAACAQGLVTPQTRDGKVTLNANDWRYGANAGALIQFSPDTRLGLSFRSAITHKLSGNATFSNPTLPGALNGLTQTPATTNGGGNAELKLPDVLSVSFHHKIDPQWSVMGDVSRTGWSRFDEIRVKFANGAADSVETQNYKDTVRAAIGATFKASDTITLRAGFALDPSPVRDTNRDPRVPDGDRKWIAIGASLKPEASTTVDVGIARLIVDAQSSNKTVVGAGSLQGRYNQINATAFAVQLSRSF